MWTGLHWSVIDVAVAFNIKAIKTMYSVWAQLKNNNRSRMEISPKSAAIPASKMSWGVMASKHASARSRCGVGNRASLAMSANMRAIAFKQQAYLRRGSAQLSNRWGAYLKCRIMSFTPPPWLPSLRTTNL
jgi:hypothetical protein